ncbi:MAG TPA: hypothetical protein VK625_07070 [Flavitalea sp.]|nr:hypothetical protein [Flavitalea sp.]
MGYYLQIYFQFGEFLNQGGTLLLDLLVATAGAFLGVWGAWQIYLIQVRRERNDILKYTAMLINSVIEKIHRQAKNCDAFARQNIGNSTNVKLLPIIINSDLTRLVDKVDQQKIFHAFRRRYNRSQLSLTTFRNIYNNLDYTYEVLNQIREYYPNEQESLVEKKKRYFQFLEKAEEMMAIATLDNHLPTPLKDFFGKTIQEFIEAKERSAFVENIGLGISILVDPVIEFLMNGYRSEPASIEITTTLRNAGVTMNLIKQQSDALAESFREYAEKLETVNEKLKADAKELLNDFTVAG